MDAPVAVAYARLADLPDASFEAGLLAAAGFVMVAGRVHLQHPAGLFPVKSEAVAEPWEGITSLLVPQALTLAMVERMGCRLPPRFQYGVMEQ